MAIARTSTLLVNIAQPLRSRIFPLNVDRLMQQRTNPGKLARGWEKDRFSRCNRNFAWEDGCQRGKESNGWARIRWNRLLVSRQSPATLSNTRSSPETEARPPGKNSYESVSLFFVFHANFPVRPLAQTGWLCESLNENLLNAYVSFLGHASGM